MQLSIILQQMKRRTVATLRVYGHFVVLLAVGGLLNCVAAANETEWMPDTDLRAAVRKTLGLAPDVSLTPQALEELTELQASPKGPSPSFMLWIDSLRGLEYATRLKKLNISSNRISDLTPLSNLTELQVLNFAGNEISDLTPLSNLTGLQDVDLAGNRISDITPLTDLMELKWLALSHNEISDLTPPAKLTELQGLALFHNEISDISALTQLTNLEALHIQSNPIQDVTPLQTLQKINPKMTIVD